MAQPARQTVETTDETVAFRSRRFGNYMVAAERVVHFAEGLIGFPAARRFVLLEPECPDSPFRCLVCLDTPELGFVVCEPRALWPGYATDLPLPAAAEAGDVAVLAIVTVPVDPRQMTANLLAPLVIDSRTRSGQQVVLDTGRYSTRHPILAPAIPTHE